MIMILFDAAVLYGLVYFFLKEQSPDLRFMILVTLLLTAINAALAMFVAPIIGLLVLIPMALIVALVLAYLCHLTIPHAAIATTIFIVYKVLYKLVVLSLVGG